MQVLVTMPTPATFPYPHTLAITVEASNGINLDFQMDPNITAVSRI
ncbi:MAG: hypothetical protein J6O89_02180 [Aeriscardovia sp.]|nr:hypothetical protein [Aeriscardovia sp.]